MSSARLQRLAAAIDAMSLRERAMLAVIMVLLLWAAWQGLLMAPLIAQRKALALRTETASTSVAALNRSIQALATQRSQDPLAQQRRQLERLHTQTRELDSQLAEATSSLIDPKQMGAVLEAILAKQPAVTVVGLSSLPAESMQTETEAAMPLSPQTDVPVPRAQARLFRHGLVLEVEGNYLDLLHFLQALDALPWEFIWSDLSLSVDEHARSHLRLTLHTLSLRRGWLGV